MEINPSKDKRLISLLNARGTSPGTYTAIKQSRLLESIDMVHTNFYKRTFPLFFKKS